MCGLNLLNCMAYWCRETQPSCRLHFFIDVCLDTKSIEYHLQFLMYESIIYVVFVWYGTCCDDVYGATVCLPL
jgi:hypothetical protein